MTKTESTRHTTVNSVPLLDIGRGNRPLREEILKAVTKVIDSGRFLHGPDVQEFEKKSAEYSGAEHAISCASGSDALLLALMAHDIGGGDEVIVPSFTFFATASAVARLGAKPVFADIEPGTFNLDVNSVKRVVTPRTKAIIPVHLFGQCADMDPLLSLARHHGLHVIEDAAQAIGAKYRGRGAGAIGDIGCISYYPTKNLGGFGDGGMLTTNDARTAERLRLLAGHGMSPRYYHKVIGINSRLDTIQAAVLNIKLRELPKWTIARQANATRYDELLADAGLNKHLGLPQTLSHNEHVWNQYTIRIPGGRRDDIRTRLAAAGVASEVYYPVPLHLQECFRPLGWREGSLPETERAAREVLSLPNFPELTEEEQHTVIQRLAEVCRPARSAAA